MSLLETTEQLLSPDSAASMQPQSISQAKGFIMSCELSFREKPIFQHQAELAERIGQNIPFIISDRDHRLRTAEAFLFGGVLAIDLIEELYRPDELETINKHFIEIPTNVVGSDEDEQLIDRAKERWIDGHDAAAGSYKDTLERWQLNLYPDAAQGSELLQYGFYYLVGTAIVAALDDEMSTLLWEL